VNFDPSGSAHDLLMNGILCAKEGDADRARFYLEWVLRESATSDQRKKALYYLSKIAQGPNEQLAWIEELLIVDPSHPEARRDLAVLRGQLSAADIIDPNEPLPDSSAAPIAKRKTNCDQCGGKLVFSPDGRALDCERCGIRYPQEPVKEAAVQTNDFAVELAQIKGHASPRPMPTFSCLSCGATFGQPEARLSLTCPYCGTAFIPEDNPRDWISPRFILPFQIDEDAALSIARQHRMAGTTSEQLALRGMFFPVWDFEASGQLSVVARDGSGVVLAHWPIGNPHVFVAATGSLPAQAIAQPDPIDFSGAAPYQPQLLADRSAEMYTIAPADASLTARELMLQQEMASHPIPPMGFVNSAGLSILTCSLVLVPFWIGRTSSQTFFINGQTGRWTNSH
jgi:hypothetical protein